MYKILQITTDAKQKKIVNLPDGGSFEMSMYFMPMQKIWVMTSLVYEEEEFVLNGIRICNSPNLLYQFRNQIPFGIACLPNTDADREPSLLEDFSTDACSLYVLSADEVAAYTRYLSES